MEPAKKKRYRGARKRSWLGIGKRRLFRLDMGLNQSNVPGLRTEEMVIISTQQSKKYKSNRFMRFKRLPPSTA